MKVCNKCKEEKELKKFNKRKAHKDGYANRCKVCYKLVNDEWRNTNKEKIAKKMSEWYYNNFDQHKASNLKYKENNKEKLKAYTIKYDEENKEKKKIRDALWTKANADVKAEQRAKRRARKLNQTPILTDEETQKIRDIYKESQGLTKSTGEQRYVHHILPLEDGGSHHPDNLEILTFNEHIQAHRIIDMGKKLDKDKESH